MAKTRILPISFMLALIATAGFTYADSSEGNKANERFLALSEDVRSRLFQILLDKSDVQCGGVDGNVFQTLDKQQTGYWTVSCADAEFYSVQVLNDVKGSMKVKTCLEMLDTPMACNASKPAEVVEQVEQEEAEQQASTELASI